ncbi:MAG TPA: long-chain fatty acid--CoA ligase [Zeimonas sp.]|nr:long-chain fatty acid--CoA ligase [Zeimonas sp.]
MSERHRAFWPRGVPHHLTTPEVPLVHNARVAAERYPDKPYLVFYDTRIGFARFLDEVERVAGWLEHEAGVRRGDRVLLYLQNSPQFVIGYYAILRANAIVVPVNPMNLEAELRHCVDDSGARTAIVGQELYARVRPLLGDALDHVIVAAYSDYLEAPTDLPVPAFVAEPRAAIDDAGAVTWHGAMRSGLRPGALVVGPDDLCVMPYTSGTTGRPKGCMHTHRNAQFTAIAGLQWFGLTQDATVLSVLPFFHVTGMQGSMNGPLFVGATVVLLPRWDRVAAARLIERYRVSAWTAIPTMVVDFLAQPGLSRASLASLDRMSGGGAAMPEAVAARLQELCGIEYVEGYGLTETMAPSHINPPQRPKRQCLGIPIFDTDARVVDVDTMRELPPGEVGEIVVHGPQVFQGYWGNEAATREAFVEIDGKRFLRTGDLGRTDEDGYFFLVDRLKRMINASGYKVWPAEVESMLYAHPAIQEACVIAADDPYRGETVKAVVVLREAARGQVTGEEIAEWARARMAAYKVPRIVEFVEALPKSATGKIRWRALQEAERARG